MEDINKGIQTTDMLCKTQNSKGYNYGIYKIKRNINRLLLFILIFAIVFMPSDSMHLKKSSFILLLVINFNLIIKYVLKKENFVILFFAVFFPIVLIVFSTLVNNFNITSPISIAYIMLYLLIIPIIIYYKINYEKVFIFILTMLSIFIAFSGLLDLFGIWSLSNNLILQFLNENNEANVGLWPTTTFGYVIFLKASPVLIILVGYAVKNKLNILLAITVIAMAFTGTRANLYMSILVICIYYSFYTKKSISKLIIIFLFTLVVILNLGNIIDSIRNMSAIKAYSDLTKYEHIKSIMAFLSQNPLYLITGSGLGSYFYSTGVMGYTNLTEVAYLDLYRQIGLIGFIPFMYFLLKPMKYLFTDKYYKWLAISYIGYLLIAFTNPLLFSSTPFALYIYIYLRYMEYRKTIIQ